MRDWDRTPPVLTGHAFGTPTASAVGVFPLDTQMPSASEVFDFQAVLCSCHGCRAQVAEPAITHTTLDIELPASTNHKKPQSPIDRFDALSMMQLHLRKQLAALLRWGKFGSC